MIRGYKPNGYYVAYNGDGTKTEGETRQCVHCQFTWEYRPGSGIQRGWCLKCSGLICARAECEQEQLRMKQLFPQKDLSCIPFSDLNKRLLDQYDKDPRFTVLPSGIVVSVGS